MKKTIWIIIILISILVTLVGCVDPNYSNRNAIVRSTPTQKVIHSYSPFDIVPPDGVDVVDLYIWAKITGIFP